MAQERISITFHLVPGKDKDDDLIEMLQSVRGPERAQLIKSRLREQAHVPSRGMPDYTPILDDLAGRVHWLQENVYALPETIEQMIARMTVHSVASIPPNIPPPKERASKAALDRRKERTKKNAW